MKILEPDYGTKGSLRTTTKSELQIRPLFPCAQEAGHFVSHYRRRTDDEAISNVSTESRVPRQEPNPQSQKLNLPGVVHINVKDNYLLVSTVHRPVSFVSTGTGTLMLQSLNYRHEVDMYMELYEISKIQILHLGNSCK